MLLLCTFPDRRTDRETVLADRLYQRDTVILSAQRPCMVAPTRATSLCACVTFATALPHLGLHEL